VHGVRQPPAVDPRLILDVELVEAEVAGRPAGVLQPDRAAHGVAGRKAAELEDGLAIERVPDGQVTRRAGENRERLRALRPRQDHIRAHGNDRANGGKRQQPRYRDRTHHQLRGYIGLPEPKMRAI
jgi:hypothetical protein